MRILPRLLLLVHAVSLDNPVIPLGAGDGTAQPDLFVGGLFVENVGSDGGDGYVQDAGLEVDISFVVWGEVDRETQVKNK